MMKKALSAFALSLFFSATAMAAFPDKPVKIIVSNPPGGPVDVMLRVLATRLSTVWGQPVIVENKPGGSGIVSTSALVKSPPDGHTLGMFVASAITIMPFAVDSLPYDPVKDLQPISLVARTPFVFVVAQNSPLKTWADFVQQAGKKDMSLGSLSVGTAFHLVWEQTARQAGIKALYVPSPSSGKTQLDLMGGLLDVVLDAPSSAKGLIDSGKLRALAITSPERFSGLPNTPTLNEAGLKGYSSALDCPDGPRRPAGSHRVANPGHSRLHPERTRHENPDGNPGHDPGRQQPRRAGRHHPERPQGHGAAGQAAGDQAAVACLTGQQLNLLLIQ